MPDNETITVALANFFYETWQHYCEGPTEDVEAILKSSVLVEEHEVTAEDVANETYEVEEGDIVYVLSDLGKIAWRMAADDNGTTEE